MELAPIKFIDNIILHMDNTRIRTIPVALFLVLSHVCDTVNCDILLNKLQYYGVNGVSQLSNNMCLNERYCTTLNFQSHLILCRSSPFYKFY